ncbi:hypothetical protein AVEN_71633-1 [Araneus ventricosus]|uniref:Uncharacterized protein n=1 Tax=Araneus ventricosus TaxID=182803 RepID=A0A4Y2KJB9_ARAVE|nr:hypothetical protein AVEN_71633-1 [Araneus ventricosus]
MFESDFPIVMTSMKEKVESLMRQDRDCRPGDPISPIQADECVLLCPYCVIIQEQNLLTQEPWSGPTAPSDFYLFSCVEVSSIRTSLSNLFIRLALRL